MSDASKLRIHSIIPNSTANGPGRRLVIWVQGCTLNCPGCFNANTHPRVIADSQLMTVADVLKQIVAAKETHGIEGITISGGEPLQQMRPVIELMRLVKAHIGLSIVLFTGFADSELVQMPDFVEVTRHADVIISGRYEAGNRIASELRGSSNKKLRFITERYSHKDFQSVPKRELIISRNGQVVATGINPASLQSA